MDYPNLYLAGPSGFSEFGNLAIISLEKILSEKFHVINPFKEGAALGTKIEQFNQDLIEGGSFSTIKKKLHSINLELARKNAEYIANADIILAILDGVDVDSGTSAEIGYAFALHKPIWGYRGDFRLTGDNLGSKINLQVEYFIEASGGSIFSSLDEIRNWIANGLGK
ncbi:MAG: nucleoside 2-deoxyribosyltransferase [Promethearchaeota archaeon]